MKSIPESTSRKHNGGGVAEEKIAAAKSSTKNNNGGHHGDGAAANDNNNNSCMAIAFGRNYFGAVGGTEKVGGLYRWSAPSWGSAASSTHSTASNTLNTDDQRIAQVECSTQSTLFLTERTGKVFQTGTLHGVKHNVPVPVTIPLPLKCVQISAGRHFCLARMEGGQAVVSWGAGHFGQLGLGHHTTTTSTAEGGGDSQITFSPQPLVIERLLPRVIGCTVQSIACGDWHALALSESGRVWAWGSNRSQQCGRKPSSVSSSSTQAPTLLVPLPVPLDVKATQITAGRSHSVAVCNENVYCWGSTQHGQCGNSARRSGVTSPRLVEGIRSVRVASVQAAGNHTLALSAGGRVFAWGSNVEGQLGTGPPCFAQPKPRQINDLDFVSIEAGHGWRQLKDNSNAEMEKAFTENQRIAQTLRSVPTIAKIIAGPSYSAAISSSGHVYAWGSNDAGQIGIETPSGITLEDKVLHSVSSNDLLIKERAQDIRTFDSRHNILLPSRVSVLDDLFVNIVACGPNHMWCIGRSRQESDNSRVGRSLYEAELQVKQQNKQEAAKQSAIAGVVAVAGDDGDDNNNIAGASSANNNNNSIVQEESNNNSTEDRMNSSCGNNNNNNGLMSSIGGLHFAEASSTTEFSAAATAGMLLNGLHVRDPPASPTSIGEADTAGTDTEASTFDYKPPSPGSRTSFLSAAGLPLDSSMNNNNNNHNNAAGAAAIKPNRRKGLMKKLSSRILRRKNKK